MTLATLLNAPHAELAERGLLHTPREIAQQADTWPGTVARVRELGPRLSDALDGLGLGTAHAPGVILLGAGSSDYVGRSLSHELRRRWGCTVEVVPTTDFATHEQSLLLPQLPYVSVSFSRSGRSPESVLAAERMLERKPYAPQLLVTCDAGGTMAERLAQRPRALTLLLDDAVNDRSLAMTSSYSNMLIAGLGLAHHAALDELEQLVGSLAEAWRRLLVDADGLAEQLAGRSFSKVYCLGSGPLYGVARESALKLLELTAGRVNSASETFLGVRHGPLSALDGKALVVAFVSSEPRVRKFELDLLRELTQKRLAAETVVLAQRPEPELAATASHLLSVELAATVPDDFLTPVMVLFGQLLGLYGSIAHGLEPDAPSPDGVINRVVAGVKMHA
jgi:tagatose-6-phosphate ketose/aldose isomerase